MLLQIAKCVGTVFKCWPLWHGLAIGKAFVPAHGDLPMFRKAPIDRCQKFGIFFRGGKTLRR